MTDGVELAVQLALHSPTPQVKSLPLQTFVPDPQVSAQLPPPQMMSPLLHALEPLQVTAHA